MPRKRIAVSFSFVATALIETDPELAGHPALAAMLAQFVDEERAEYLEKG